MKTGTGDKGSKITASSKIESQILRITSFIRDYVNGSEANGVVVGLSGGVDSSVVASLSVRALGPHRVLGVYLFEEGSTSQDLRDAMGVAKSLGLKTLDISISPLLQPIQKMLESRLRTVSKITSANIKARIRMVLLYAIANQKKLLVAGTGDRSELLVGYYTKYGDGAADILPIAHLYKGEVRQIAQALNLPPEIAMKPSSPNLWKGQKATDELPADYPELDKILALLYDARKSPAQVSRIAGVSQAKVKMTIMMNSKSKHKRALPASLER
ncbi:MAG TPA: NAD+ synthase [Nitrososphaerales archaeon]|nr:NAD+ synthase [Nitrososphaerales archaeon]